MAYVGGHSHLLVGDFRILGYSNEAILIALQQHQGVKAFPLQFMLIRGYPDRPEQSTNLLRWFRTAFYL